jgi:hypothetical protein
MDFRARRWTTQDLCVASIVLMVICGADYQQFVLAARTPAMARNGCLLAAGFVFLIGFLPASAVIAATPVWHLQRLANAVQVIPVVLMHTLSGHSANTARTVVIVVSLTTALGAGCSILRAMTDAAASLGQHPASRPIWSRLLPIALGTIVAIHGQSLVDMMCRSEHGLHYRRRPARGIHIAQPSHLRQVGQHNIGDRWRHGYPDLPREVDRLHDDPGDHSVDRLLTSLVPYCRTALAALNILSGK